MTYNSTTNARLIKVALKKRADETGQTAASPYRDLYGARTPAGEPSYEEIDLVVDIAPWILQTWVDVDRQRRQELTVLAEDVDAVWEMSKWIQERLLEHPDIDRDFTTGDMVLFDSFSTWFIISTDKHDAGIFNTNIHQRYLLKRSSKPEV